MEMEWAGGEMEAEELDSAGLSKANSGEMNKIDVAFNLIHDRFIPIKYEWDETDAPVDADELPAFIVALVQAPERPIAHYRIPLGISGREMPTCITTSTTGPFLDAV